MPTDPIPSYRLLISLKEIDPPVWRRVLIPGDLSLGGLHEVIQTLFGWSGVHHHDFVVKRRTFASAESPYVDVGEDESAFSLHGLEVKKGYRFRYLYDPVAPWKHSLRVEAIHSPGDADGECGVVPLCLGGARNAPPDNCGGPYGYEELLAGLNDPGNPDHARYNWLAGPGFDPETFDPDEANRRLRKAFS